MVGLSLWIERINHHKNEQIVIARYLNIAKELLPAIVDNNQAKLQRKVTSLNLISKPKIEGEAILNRPITFGVISILKTKLGYGVEIAYLDEVYHFEDQNIELFDQEQFIVNLLLILDIFILLLIYVVTLKIIAPIRELSNSMQRFSKGAFNIQIPLRGVSEIQELSLSFNQMAKSLKEAIEERENLLKYIGHELKTPLAKSKFALEMNQPDTLRQTIDDMDRLVSEILEMHLLSKKNLNLSSFKAQTLITQTLNRLYIKDESSLEISLDDFEIRGDINHLSVALKNLIDNALKYTTDSPIMIVSRPKTIEVISWGEPLSQPLEFYLEAFTQENPKNVGYGLGLNIVKRVVEAHNFKLEYEHKEGRNIFKIGF
jgi:two-component system OmpR family sensor kinase